MNMTIKQESVNLRRLTIGLIIVIVEIVRDKGIDTWILVVKKSINCI